MNKIPCTVSLAVCVVVAMAGPAAFGSSRQSVDVPFSTPAGITLVDVAAPGHSEINRFLWKRFGDESGKALYTYDNDSKGKATCAGDCAKEFPPMLADPGAKPAREWSLVKRPEGRQWAYLGQPLYRYSGVDPSRDAAAAAGKPITDDPSGAAFSPKAGWKQAVFDPAKSVPTPADIKLRSLATANGYGFVGVSGMPLYALDAAPADPNAWTPVYAAALAVRVGSFMPALRKDGTRQWAYKGQPLYTFNGDYADSDINGTIADSNARIALAYRHFMPISIAINVVPTRGPIMMTANGLSVYTESRQHLQYGGRETRQGYHFSYTDAKAVGTRGCLKECVSTWHPVAAPAGARSWGCWEVVTRDDGSKQWAYKGSPLYTFAQDKAAGDIEGNNRHVVIYGDVHGKTDLTITGGDAAEPNNNYGVYGSGLYWHLVTLID